MSNEELAIVPYDDKMEIIFMGRTPYLSQAQMAALFGISRDAVSETLRSAEKRGFIDLNSTTKEFLVVTSDGKERTVNHYSLKAILLVGFRVQAATPSVIAFQDWVTSIVENHIHNLQERNENLQIALEYEQMAKGLAEWESEKAQRELNDHILIDLMDRYPEEDI